MATMCRCFDQKLRTAGQVLMSPETCDESIAEARYTVGSGSLVVGEALKNNGPTDRADVLCDLCATLSDSRCRVWLRSQGAGFLVVDPKTQGRLALKQRWQGGLSAPTHRICSGLNRRSPAPGSDTHLLTPARDAGHGSRARPADLHTGGMLHLCQSLKAQVRARRRDRNEGKCRVLFVERPAGLRFLSSARPTTRARKSLVSHKEDGQGRQRPGMTRRVRI
ncbi:hypothetical protein ANO11243_066970 [Dothideomycetidae sp. 11243]|nr:hypothetical protein ANO11243_066970 [fungal sp. No.11243]